MCQKFDERQYIVIEKSIWYDNFWCSLAVVSRQNNIRCQERERGIYISKKVKTNSSRTSTALTVRLVTLASTRETYVECNRDSV
jgi:hypothetical protein